MGGLARRASLIEALRKEADGVLVVDAGDDLTGPQVPTQQTALRAKLVLDIYDKIGIDAWGRGELDAVPGLDPRAIHAADRALVTRAGVPIGVFSMDITEADATRPGSTIFGAHAAAAPKRPAAPGQGQLTKYQREEQARFAELQRRAAAERKRGARLVVALLHGGYQEARKLLEAGPSGVDIAVASHGSGGGHEKVGDTWLYEPPAQGKQFCELDLHLLDDKPTFVDLGMRGQYETMLADTENALLDTIDRQAAAAADLSGFYEQQKKQMQDSVSNLKKQLAALPVESPGNWLEFKLVPLSPEIPDSPPIQSLIRKYKDEVAHLPPMAPKPQDVGYAGAQTCRGCHAPAYAFWQKTRHAHAFQTLVKKQQDKDPACVNCHVTNSLPDLRDVQCEECHGPGARHAAQPATKGLITRAPTEANCRRCHTAEQTGAFDFEHFKKAILGHGHGQK